MPASTHRIADYAVVLPLLAMLALTSNTAFSQEAHTNFPALPDDEARQTIQWAVYLIQANLPPTYSSKKNWGEKKRIYAGVDIKQDGLKLRTHRKYREVNHGKWLRYKIDLQDPNDPRYLRIEVLRAESKRPGRLSLSLQIDTQVDIDAQQQRWNYGVRAYSVTTQAKAKLRMTIDADIGFAFDYSAIPPDVLFDPVVQKADIKLVDLEVDKIGILGSDIAEEVGDIAARVIRDEYLPRQRDKLPTKLNHQIDRRRDKLRLSLSDWLAKRLSASAPGTSIKP